MSSKNKKKMNASQAAAARWDAPDPNKPVVEHKQGFARFVQKNGVGGIVGTIASVALIVFALMVLLGVMS